MIKSVRQLHHEAMDTWDNVLLCKRRGDMTSAILLAILACELESAAAERCMKEPSKAILRDSANAMQANIDQWSKQLDY